MITVKHANVLEAALDTIAEGGYSSAPGPLSYSPVKQGDITARNRDLSVLAVGPGARADHEAAVAVVYRGSLTAEHGLYWAVDTGRGRLALYHKWDDLRPHMRGVRVESVTPLTAAR